MKSEKIAIFESNEEFLTELKEYVSETDGLEVCAATENGNVAIDMIKRNCRHSGFGAYGVRRVWRSRLHT